MPIKQIYYIGMQYRKTDRGYIIKIEQGEEVIQTLTAFCAEHGIAAGEFTGIGAVASAEFGYYDLSAKEYVFQERNEMMEVASMTGNVALVNGEHFLHVHAVLADTERRAHGGHIKQAVVGVTLEVFLTPHETSVERNLEEEIGLKLFNLE